MTAFISKNNEMKSLCDRLVDAQPNLSRKHGHIATLILDDPVLFIRQTSKELCAYLGASEPTVIRFCQSFGYNGLADFRIDLALAVATNQQNIFTIEPSANDRRHVNFDAKQEIVERAASLLQDDRNIVIDNGSTMEQFAKQLGKTEPLRVITSGLAVAQNVLTHNKHKVTLTGGHIRPDALSLSGRLAEASIAEMRFDTAYLGADSIDVESGLSTFLEDEAYLTRAMVRASTRVVVLADQSKFRNSRLHWICDLKSVDILVTDASPDDPTVTKIRAMGVQVISTKE